MQPLQYQLASFSSAGPTYEGFVKPEILGMGGHMLAYAPNTARWLRSFRSGSDRTMTSRCRARRKPLPW